jgi:isocitrate lyase
MQASEEAAELERRWAEDPRWRGIERPYAGHDVVHLRGSVRIEHTLARRGAERLWGMLDGGEHVAALGALTGGQAVQMVRAGLKAVYVSGWQVAADANLAGDVFPDQGLYPGNSGSALVRRLNRALCRADQIDWIHERNGTDWLVPIVADAEEGFGSPLSAFETMRAMIEAGAAGVHFEDQLTSAKKLGSHGGKVLLPTGRALRTLVAARLAADVLDVPTLLIARTDGLQGTLLTTDADPRDHEFMTGERTPHGEYVIRPGVDAAIARALAYAPYADVVWYVTTEPDLDVARQFAAAIHERFPGKTLAYNCPPSFNWRAEFGDTGAARFQLELAEIGYRFQFVTTAGFHSLSAAMFDVSCRYAGDGMLGYTSVYEKELELEPLGYTAIDQHREVGAAYFDRVSAVTEMSDGAAAPSAIG